MVRALRAVGGLLSKLRPPADQEPLGPSNAVNSLVTVKSPEMSAQLLTVDSRVRHLLSAASHLVAYFEQGPVIVTNVIEKVGVTKTHPEGRAVDVRALNLSADLKSRLVALGEAFSEGGMVSVVWERAGEGSATAQHLHLQVPRHT